MKNSKLSFTHNSTSLVIEGDLFINGTFKGVIIENPKNDKRYKVGEKVKTHVNNLARFYTLNSK